MTTDFRIVVLPGDGIGVEVMDACLALLEPVQRKVGGFRLAYEPHPGGAGAYRDTGVAFSDAAMKACERADAILFGSMGLPDVRYPDGTEIAPQLDLRKHLELYAGVRPIRAIPGVPLPARRPAREGHRLRAGARADRGLVLRAVQRSAAPAATDDVAYDIGRITRAGSERLFEFAFRLAERRKRRNPKKGRVTCVDKANVHRGFALFRKVFWERARSAIPDIAADDAYIDALALDLVRKPWDYDVLPTENQFGDILSDLGAGLIGGMGLAPSGDIGDEHALFQPAGGTAPDIAGKGIANPTATFLSAAMMLEWLGERHGVPKALEAAERIERAVDAAFASGKVMSVEFGGKDGTAAITRAVVDAL